MLKFPLKYNLFKLSGGLKLSTLYSCSNSVADNIAFPLQNKQFYTSEFRQVKMNENMENLIAVGQMCSTSDKDDNWNQLEGIVCKATQQGAKVVFLPECCDYIAKSSKESLALAENITGPFVNKLKALAKREKVWLSVGGVHIKSTCGDDSRLSNTHLLVNSEGNVCGEYSKTHLFSNSIPGVAINEADYVRPGDQICPPIATPAGNIGLAICYDLRFPELSQALRRLGAHILTFPSAFTVATGTAHWHTLLRARAIECQCYVVAATQTGQHNTKRSSYGHALIVDPWGRVLVELTGGGGEVGVARVGLQDVCRVRREMPCVMHSRQDLAALHLPALNDKLPSLLHLEPPPPPSTLLQFGSVTVPGDGVFLFSSQAHAFSNLFPRQLGHSMVSPSRVVRRVVDLSVGEVSAVSQMCVAAHRALCSTHFVTHCEVALQDGPHSGQTIQHVHVHLLPHHQREGSVLGPDVPSDAQSPEALQQSRAEKEEAMIQHAKIVRTAVAPQAMHGDTEMSLYIPQPFKSVAIAGGGGVAGVAEDAVCVRGVHTVAYCVAGNWQTCHVIVQLLRSVETLSDVRANEAYELFAVAQRLQSALATAVKDVSTTFVIGRKKQGFESVHLHVLPWLKLREHSDEVYSYVAEYQPSSGTPEYSLASALRQAMLGDGSDLKTILVE